MWDALALGSGSGNESNQAKEATQRRMIGTQPVQAPARHSMEQRCERPGRAAPIKGMRDHARGGGVHAGLDSVSTRKAMSLSHPQHRRSRQLQAGSRHTHRRLRLDVARRRKL